jgi:hypothetical protein
VKMAHIETPEASSASSSTTSSPGQALLAGSCGSHWVSWSGLPSRRSVVRTLSGELWAAVCPRSLRGRFWYSHHVSVPSPPANRQLTSSCSSSSSSGGNSTACSVGSRPLMRALQLTKGMIQPDREPFCSPGTIGVFWKYWLPGGIVWISERVLREVRGE